MMSTIASLWRYETAAFRARDPPEHLIACEFNVRLALTGRIYFHAFLDVTNGRRRPNGTNSSELLLCRPRRMLRKLPQEIVGVLGQTIALGLSTLNAGL
jgi:hypothetical protein